MGRRRPCFLVTKPYYLNSQACVNWQLDHTGTATRQVRTRIRLAKPMRMVSSWARMLVLIHRRGTQCKIPAHHGMALLEKPMWAGGRVVGPSHANLGFGSTGGKRARGLGCGEYLDLKPQLAGSRACMQGRVDCSWEG